MIKTKSAKLKFIFNIILFVLFFTLSLFVREKINSMLPVSTEYTILDNKEEDNEKVIQISEIDEVINHVNDLTINIQNRETGIAKSQISPLLFENVNIISTDEKYPTLHNINIIKGGFISSRSSDGVVISEELANSFFKNINVIGNTINLSGEVKTITGIYDCEKNILNEISSNGLETVFVSFDTQLDDINKSEVETIYIQKKSGEISSKEIDQLNTYLNGKLEFYKKTNLNESKRFLLQLFDILIFFMGLIVVIKLISKLIRGINKMIKYILVMKEFHLKIRLKEAIKYMIFPIFCIAFIILIIALCKFKFYLPDGVLPENDRIFDITYYYEFIINKIQNIKLLERWHYYQDLIVVLYMAMTTLILCTIITFTKLFRVIVKLIEGWVSKLIKNQSN